MPVRDFVTRFFDFMVAVLLCLYGMVYCGVKVNLTHLRDLY